MKRTQANTLDNYFTAPHSNSGSSSSLSSTRAKKAKAAEDSPVSLSSPSLTSPPAVIGVVWRFYSLYCRRQETLDKSAACRMNPCVSPEFNSIHITPPFTPTANEIPTAPQVHHTGMEPNVSVVKKYFLTNREKKTKRKPIRFKVRYHANMSPSDCYVCDVICDDEGNITGFTLEETCILEAAELIAKNRGIKTKSKANQICPAFILGISNHEMGLPCIYDVIISNNTCSLMNQSGGVYFKKPCIACVAIKNKAVDNMKKMEDHREIKKRAAEAEDEAEKKRIMMESSVFKHNQLPGRVLPTIILIELTPIILPLYTQHARIREQSLVSAQIYRLADAMSQRDPHSRDECIDLIISVAIEGRVIGGRCPTRTPEERASAYEQLEDGGGARCTHCGVAVTWKAGQESQKWVATLIQGKKPFVAVYFANERAALVTTFTERYNPNLADAVVDCYIADDDDTTANEKLSEFGVSRKCLIPSNELAVIFANQKTHSIARKKEDRRISHTILNVTGDRIWDADGYYLATDVVLMGVQINDAKFAHPAFHSKESLNKYQVDNDIPLMLHPYKVLVALLEQRMFGTVLNYHHLNLEPNFTNENICVYQHLIDTYSKYIKGVTFDGLKGIFEEGEIDTGVTTNQVVQFCEKYGISLYAMDLEFEIFCRHIPKVRNHHIPCLIYIVANNHMYPVLEEELRRSIVASERRKGTNSHRVFKAKEKQST
ncbi:hypothetical protein CcCBS67573_g10219 [Chytriomyces confervae]|uniref:Uncharacterized protein n=1 Tax=Chytriomyces confervae TaxID=246404 RepID=A0A507D982_9FUNG|nr:hypothetical protein CcCBS67573_g10219 [Chytriomyces confervae]